MVASVRTDPEFAVLSRNRFASAEGFVSITTTQHYDLAAADDRLLALRAGGGPGAQVRDVVVLGFFEELKRLVPN